MMWNNGMGSGMGWMWIFWLLVILGTVVIKAGGDVTLSEEMLDDLATQLEGQDIGTVLIDTSIWPDEGFASTWDPVDVDAGYIADVEPAMIVVFCGVFNTALAEFRTGGDLSQRKDPVEVLTERIKAQLLHSNENESES